MALQWGTTLSTVIIFLVYEYAIDASSTQIRGQVIDELGVPVGTDFLIYHNPPGNWNPALAYDSANGIFLVVWENYPGVGGDSNIFGAYVS
jgi:hypothetical protein